MKNRLKLSIIFNLIDIKESFRISDLVESILKRNKYVEVSFRKDLQHINPIFFGLMSSLLKIDNIIILNFTDVENERKFQHNIFFYYHSGVFSRHKYIPELEAGKIYYICSGISNPSYNFFDSKAHYKLFPIIDQKVSTDILIKAYRRDLLAFKAKVTLFNKYADIKLPKKINNIDTLLQTYQVIKGILKDTDQSIMATKSYKELLSAFDRIRLNLLFNPNFDQIEKYKLLLSNILKKRKDNNLINYISNVVYELVDNIKEHAKNASVGMMSIRSYSVNSDSIPIYSEHSQYEEYIEREKKYHNNEIVNLLIYDNDHEGILGRYKATLQKEQGDFRKRSTKYENDIENVLTGEIEKEYSGYEMIIKQLDGDSEQNSIAFKEMFSIEKVFNLHQLSRLAYHFGIPMFVKYISETNSFFEIITSYKNNVLRLVSYRGKIEVTSLMNFPFKGTLYNICISEKSFISDEVIKLNQSTLMHRKIKLNKLLETNYKSNINEDIAAICKLKKSKYSGDICEIECGKDDYLAGAFDFNKVQRVSYSEFIRKVHDIAFDRAYTDIVFFNLDRSALIFMSLIYQTITSNNSKRNLRANYYLNPKETLAFYFLNHDVSEIAYINNELPKTFVDNNPNVLNEILGKNNIATSAAVQHPPHSIFISEQTEAIEILPIDLFNLSGGTTQFVSYIQDKIITDNLHMAISNEFHTYEYTRLDKYYDDLKINSRFALLIYLYLKNKIDNNIFGKKILIITTDNKAYNVTTILNEYLNPEDSSIITCENIPSIEKSRRYDYVLIISPILATGTSVMKTYREVLGKNTFNNSKIVLFTLFLLSDSGEDKLHKKYWNFDKAEYTGLSSINLNEENINVNYLIDMPRKWLDAAKCEKCFPSEITGEEALFNYDREIESSLFTSLETLKDSNISLNKDLSYNYDNVIACGHTKRNSNHYYYYSRTVQFFKNNKNKIKKVLEDFAIQHKTMLEKSEKFYLVSGQHQTNTHFLHYVSRYVFNNSVKLIDFGEQEKIPLNSSDKIFYVDDEISSGTTFYKYDDYIRNIFESTDNKHDVRFDGAFILINRALGVTNDKVSSSLRNKELFICFDRINIKPINTGTKTCFLCDQNKKYNNAIMTTSLDFVRFQFLRKYYKLLLVDHNKIEFKKDEVKNVIRSVIKLKAVDFVIAKYDNQIDYEYFSQLLNDFVDLIADYYKADVNIPSIKSVLRHECRIALIKALSFPELTYNKNARKFVANIVLKEIDSFIKHKQYYKETIEAPDKNDCINIQNKNLEDYIEEIYRDNNKYRIELFNFLSITASYLSLGAILSFGCLDFYFSKVVKFVMDDKSITDRKSLLHPYIYAIKYLISSRPVKGKYLNDNLLNLYQSLKNYNHTSKDLLDAVFIENTAMLERTSGDLRKLYNIIADTPYKFVNSPNEQTSLNKKTADEFKDNILNYFSALSGIPASDVTVGFYVNESLTNPFLDFNSYNRDAVLVDIFNNFELNDSPLLKGIISGIVTDNSGKMLILSETPAVSVDNSWSNVFIHDNSGKYRDHKSTSIRLVKDKSNQEYLREAKVKTALAIKIVYISSEIEDMSDRYSFDDYKAHILENGMYLPIGVLLIETKEHYIGGNEDSYNKVLEVVRAFLSLRRVFAGFARNILESSFFKEMMLSYEKEKSYLDALTNVRHTARDYDIYSVYQEIYRTYGNKPEELATQFKRLLDFSFFLKYVMEMGRYNALIQSNGHSGKGSAASNFNRGLKSGVILSDVFSNFYIGSSEKFTLFHTRLKRFLKSIDPQYKFKLASNSTLNLDIEKDMVIFNINKLTVETVIFEFILNALKNNTDKSDLVITIKNDGNKLLIMNNGAKIEVKNGKTDSNTEVLKKLIKSKGIGMRTINEICILCGIRLNLLNNETDDVCFSMEVDNEHITD